MQFFIIFLPCLQEPVLCELRVEINSVGICALFPEEKIILV